MWNCIRGVYSNPKPTIDELNVGNRGTDQEYTKDDLYAINRLSYWLIEPKIEIDSKLVVPILAATVIALFFVL